MVKKEGRMTTKQEVTVPKGTRNDVADPPFKRL